MQLYSELKSSIAGRMNRDYTTFEEISRSEAEVLLESEDEGFVILNLFSDAMVTHSDAYHVRNQSIVVEARLNCYAKLG